MRKKKITFSTGVENRNTGFNASVIKYISDPCKRISQEQEFKSRPLSTSAFCNHPKQRFLWGNKNIHLHEIIAINNQESTLSDVQ